MATVKVKLDPEGIIESLKERITITCPECGAEMDIHSDRTWKRFPDIKTSASPMEQLAKVYEEVGETVVEIMGERPEACIAEAFDIIQATETLISRVAIEACIPSNALERIYNDTISKNERRGYYGVSDDEKR